MEKLERYIKKENWPNSASLSLDSYIRILIQQYTTKYFRLSGYDWYDSCAFCDV